MLSQPGRSDAARQPRPQTRIGSIQHVTRVRTREHTGEVIRDADDVFGRKVVLAARLAACSQGGEILTSSFTRALVKCSRPIVRFGEPCPLALTALSGSPQASAGLWPG